MRFFICYNNSGLNIFADFGKDIKRGALCKSNARANDSFKKIIVVERTMKPRRDDKGYVTMGVKEFLLNENSLEL